MPFTPMNNFDTRQSFVDYVSRLVRPASALTLLTWRGGNTKYRVEELKSVIFNFQITVPLNHSFLIRKNVGGNSRRMQVTFNLP